MDVSISWEDDDMNKPTARRKRRRANSKLRFGENSVRAHKKLSGRTGRVFEKKTKSKKANCFVKALVNFPYPQLQGQ